MKHQKTIILGFLIFTLLVLAIFVGYGWNDTPSKKAALNNISKLTETEDFDDISLTIYYLDPLILTSFPLSVDDLINFNSVNKIVVDGSDVEEHIDLFKQISKDDLIPVKKTSRVDARFYYVFESEKEGKLFDVAMSGANNSVFINGIEFEENDIFFTIIIPFLTEDAKKDLLISVENNSDLR